MVQPLSEDDCDALLQAETYGHLGYWDGSEVSVIPINYVYDNEAIYCHTYEGEKMHAIRKHPNVCLQVEHVRSASEWKSVLVWGTVEELDGDQRLTASRLLVSRFSELQELLGDAAAIRWGKGSEKSETPILFRMVIRKKAGRSERP